MSDETQVEGEDGGAPEETETAGPPATTDWLVWALWDVAASGPKPGEAPDTWARELWREAGVLTVPQRTTRTTVLDQAKELVKPLLSEDAPRVRVRVCQLGEVTDGEVGMEQPPAVLTARVVPRES